MPALVASVNAGRIVAGDWAGRLRRTAIDKRPVAGRVPVRGDRVGDDEQADRPDHGGRDKAVYAYAEEDAGWWERELGRELWPGAFGENLTTRGLDVTGALIGERWAIGSAVLEVSEPRIPCRTFAGFWGVPDLVRRFTEVARPGAYLRIVTAGEIGTGDEIRVIERPAHQVTVGLAFRARTLERDLVPALLDAPQLPGAWHAWAHLLLGHQRDQWHAQGAAST